MYHILLILTDGCIHDMRETIDMIVECTNYPISIIIIGLGGGSYTAMKMLDSDERTLRDGMGRVAQRDIVQFVEMQNYFKNGVLQGDQLA